MKYHNLRGELGEKQQAAFVNLEVTNDDMDRLES